MEGIAQALVEKWQEGASTRAKPSTSGQFAGGGGGGGDGGGGSGGGAPHAGQEPLGRVLLAMG